MPRITSEERLQHGKIQVDRMLSDRPEMALLPTEARLSETDAIYEWAVAKFAGEDPSFPVYWSPDVPAWGARSTSHPPNSTNGCRASIRIRETYATGARAGERRAFDELWSCAVYSLIATARGHDYNRIHRTALRGKMERATWIRLNTEIDYDCCVQVAEFCEQVWEPWARSKGINTDPVLWNLRMPTTYDDWIRGYRDASGYPEASWGVGYDRIMARRQAVLVEHER